MDTTSQHLQLRYQGFCSTHLLWKKHDVMGVKQFTEVDNYSPVFLRKLNKKRRLGQLAEQFVFNQIETCDYSEILAENLQIQKNKSTLGELDALLLQKGKPFHLEIIYKFYVYDEHLGTSELSRWIGPNRKDSLIEKIEKLTKKQLPLLHSIESQQTLNRLKLNQYDFEQVVLFKAQLFVPYQKSVTFTKLNNDCVSGFYLHTNQINTFTNCEFFIPEKLDWFLEPHINVDWIGFDDFKILSTSYLNTQQSPLFWINDNHELKKAFLVWW